MPQPQLQNTQRSPVLLSSYGVLAACAFVFPAAYLVYRGVTEDASPLNLLLTRKTLQPLWGSLRLAVSVSVSAMALGTALAWLTARCDLPAARLWRVLLPLPLVFPSFLSAAAFIYALNPGGLINDLLATVGIDQTLEMRGFFGAWVVLTLITYPYVYLPVVARIRQLSGTLEESARLLGDTAFMVFCRICLPQMASAMAAGTLLVFLYTVSDFGAVQLMRYDTLTRVIYSNRLINQPVALSLSLILMAAAVVVVLTERMISRRLPEGTPTRVSPPIIYSLGSWRTPALGFVGSSLVASMGVPMLSLLYWAYRGILLSLRNERVVAIGLSQVVEATVNTIGVGLVTAVVAVTTVLPLAMLLGRFRSRVGSVAHTVVITMFALPAILVALSVRWALHLDVFSSLAAFGMVFLIFAYVVRFGSLAMGVSLLAVRNVPAQLHEAAQVLGASAFRRFLKVDSPMLAPALFAGAGLVLISVMKELPISLLVSPLGFRTLAMHIFHSAEEGFIAEMGMMAIVLVVALFILIWLLRVFYEDVY